jgi:FdhE protein
MPYQAGPLRRAPARLQRDVRARLTRIERANPEWRTLLAAVRVCIAALEQAPAALLASLAGLEPESDVVERPLLHGLTLQVDLRALSGIVRSLAAAAGATAEARFGSRLDGVRVTDLLKAAILEDPQRFAALTRALECRAGALLLTGRYAAIPVLHDAATRLAGRIPVGWHQGYCPVCGAWPILAESRGLEQARRLRCGRCATDWAGEWLCCSYCGERDHTRLGSLVADSPGSSIRVDGCGSCHAYLKTIPTLGPLSAAELLLCDLESVELDLAARDAGYIQPSALGFPLDVELTPQ